MHVRRAAHDKICRADLTALESATATWCTSSSALTSRSPGVVLTERLPESPVVGELHREVVVLFLDERDHGLQVVALVRRHPQLVALDLRLDASPRAAPKRRNTRSEPSHGEQVLQVIPDHIEPSTKTGRS